LSKSTHRKELIVIYRQKILKDIRFFISEPVTKFYDSLFLNLDLSFIPKFPKTGRKDFSNHFILLISNNLNTYFHYIFNQLFVNNYFDLKFFLFLNIFIVNI